MAVADIVRDYVDVDKSELRGLLSSLYLNVCDPTYGAVGDGLTLDNAACQSALDALPSTGGGIIFPPRTFLLKAGPALETHKNNIARGYDTHLALRLTKSRVHLLGYGATLKLKQAGTGNDLSYIIGNLSSDPAISDIVFEGFTFDMDAVTNNAGLQPRGVILHNGTRIAFINCTWTSSSGRGGYGMDLFNCEIVRFRGTTCEQISGGMFFAFCRHLMFDDACVWRDFNEGVDFDKRVDHVRLRGTFDGGGECIDINCGEHYDIDVSATDIDPNHANGKLAFINGKATADTWANHLTGANVTWHTSRDINLRAHVDNVAYESTMVTVGNNWQAWGSTRNQGTYPRGIRISITGRRMGKIFCQEGEVTVHDSEMTDVRTPSTGITQGAIEGTSETATAAERATALEIVNGGSGYAVGDQIMLADGTRTVTVQATVTAVDGSGAVTALSGDNAGKYTVTPGNPAATVAFTGSGTGLTLNVTWDNTYYTPEVLERSDMILRVQDVKLVDVSRSAINCRLGSRLNILGLEVIRANNEPKLYVVRAAINSGGSGYSVGDIITLDTGTANTAAQMRVFEVDGSGTITRATLHEAGDYSVAPTTTGGATTGGSGTGATVNVDLSQRDEDVRLQSNDRDCVGLIDGMYLDGQYSGDGNGFRPFFIQMTANSKVRWGSQNIGIDHQHPPGMAALSVSGIECEQEAFRLGDIAAGATKEFALTLARTGRVAVVDAFVIVDTNVTADNTDYATLQLRRYLEDGSSPAVFAQFDTSSTGITAFAPTRFQAGPLISDADAFVVRADQGQLLTFRTAPNGSGVALSGVTVVVRYMAY